MSLIMKVEEWWFFYSSKRACYQKYQREFILDKIKKLTDREGKISNNKLSGNRGMKRYLEKCKGFTKIKKGAILEDEKWDGIFGICTNIKDISAKELYSSYKKLWKIEESFRINKHTLKMRPIYHRLTRRIKAHFLICFFILYNTQIYSNIF